MKKVISVTAIGLLIFAGCSSISVEAKEQPKTWRYVDDTSMACAGGNGWSGCYKLAEVCNTDGTGCGYRYVPLRKVNTDNMQRIKEKR